jgi:hypothetical protein
LQVSSRRPVSRRAAIDHDIVADRNEFTNVQVADLHDVFELRCVVLVRVGWCWRIRVTGVLDEYWPESKHEDRQENNTIRNQIRKKNWGEKDET